jgi:hypothetical protein
MGKNESGDGPNLCKCPLCESSIPISVMKQLKQLGFAHNPYVHDNHQDMFEIDHPFNNFFRKFRQFYSDSWTTEDECMLNPEAARDPALTTQSDAVTDENKTGAFPVVAAKAALSKSKGISSTVVAKGKQKKFDANYNEIIAEQVPKAEKSWIIEFVADSFCHLLVSLQKNIILDNMAEVAMRVSYRKRYSEKANDFRLKSIIDFMRNDASLDDPITLLMRQLLAFQPCYRPTIIPAWSSIATVVISVAFEESFLRQKNIFDDDGLGTLSSSLLAKSMNKFQSQKPMTLRKCLRIMSFLFETQQPHWNMLPLIAACVEYAQPQPWSEASQARLLQLIFHVAGAGDKIASIQKHARKSPSNQTIGIGFSSAPGSAPGPGPQTSESMDRENKEREKEVPPMLSIPSQTQPDGTRSPLLSTPANHSPGQGKQMSFNAASPSRLMTTEGVPKLAKLRQIAALAEEFWSCEVVEKDFVDLAESPGGFSHSSQRSRGKRKTATGNSRRKNQHSNVSISNLGLISDGCLANIDFATAIEFAQHYTLTACELAIVLIGAWEAEYISVRDALRAVPPPKPPSPVPIVLSRVPLRADLRIAMMRIFKYHVLEARQCKQETYSNHPNGGHRRGSVLMKNPNQTNGGSVIDRSKIRYKFDDSTDIFTEDKIQAFNTDYRIDWQTVKSMAKDRVYPFKVPEDIHERSSAQLDIDIELILERQRSHRFRDAIGDLVSIHEPYGNVKEQGSDVDDEEFNMLHVRNLEELIEQMSTVEESEASGDVDYGFDDNSGSPGSVSGIADDFGTPRGDAKQLSFHADVIQRDIEKEQSRPQSQSQSRQPSRPQSSGQSKALIVGVDESLLNQIEKERGSTADKQGEESVARSGLASHVVDAPAALIKGLGLDPGGPRKPGSAQRHRVTHYGGDESDESSLESNTEDLFKKFKEENIAAAKERVSSRAEQRDALRSRGHGGKNGNNAKGSEPPSPSSRLSKVNFKPAPSLAAKDSILVTAGNLTMGRRPSSPDHEHERDEAEAELSYAEMELEAERAKTYPEIVTMRNASMNSTALQSIVAVHFDKERIKKIRCLDLSNTVLDLACCKLLASSFRSHCVIQQLNLNDCSVGEKGIIEMLDGLSEGGATESLIRLDLCNNRLVLSGASSRLLGRFYNLRNLNLSRNNITLDIKRQQKLFYDMLRPLYNLETLSLACNRLQDTGLDIVLQVCAKLESLRLLDISRCFLTDKSCPLLHTLIKRSGRKLKYVLLQENLFFAERYHELRFLSKVHSVFLALDEEEHYYSGPWTTHMFEFSETAASVYY